MRLLIALATMLAPIAAQAQVITGTAHAVDGDSLEMAGTRVRLLGIDAPEGRQTCQRGGAAGCSVVQISSIIGHRTYQMALKYARQRRNAEAAMERLEKAG